MTALKVLPSNHHSHAHIKQQENQLPTDLLSQSNNIDNKKRKLDIDNNTIDSIDISNSNNNNNNKRIHIDSSNYGYTHIQNSNDSIDASSPEASSASDSPMNSSITSEATTPSNSCDLNDFSKQSIENTENDQSNTATNTATTDSPKLTNQEKLENNTDFISLCSTLSLLKRQLEISKNDIINLKNLKLNYLNNPVNIIDSLNSKKFNKNLPKKLNVLNLPEINWEKYNTSNKSIDLLFNNENNNHSINSTNKCFKCGYNNIKDSIQFKNLRFFDNSKDNLNNKFELDKLIDNNNNNLNHYHI
ncbi:hypothetical protein BVG19_g5737 [[Candida] boidinii]|nr:hypothetical protein BVG19_g5737 [[Candida] boidinii]OWB53940.1 hypothetical protein B5S27_g5557 [[Candida] boidinii]